MDTVFQMQSCKCLNGWESPLASSAGCSPGNTLSSWLLCLPTHVTESYSTCPPEHSGPFLQRYFFGFCFLN